MSRPPAISTIGGSKARSAAMTASGCVPCESLTNRTPSTIATRSRRCSTPANARRRAPDRLRRDPEQEARRRWRPGRSRRCGGPGSRSSATGMIRPPRPIAATAASSRAARCPSATIQPSATPTPPGVPRPGGTRRRAPASAGVRRDDRIVGVQDERAVRVDELGEPPLHRAVGLERAVPVEVVGRSRSCRRRPSCRATASAAAARTAR